VTVLRNQFDSSNLQKCLCLQYSTKMNAIFTSKYIIQAFYARSETRWVRMHSLTSTEFTVIPFVHIKSNALYNKLTVTGLTDINGVRRTNPVPPVFRVIWHNYMTPRTDFTVALSVYSKTPAKPRPIRPHLPRWTLTPPAPPAPPSQAPRTTAGGPSIVPPRLIIHSNRVGLEPNLPLATHKPPRLPALCSLRNVLDLLRCIARLYVHRVLN
jgi:hypothetical protein